MTESKPARRGRRWVAMAASGVVLTTSAVAAHGAVLERSAAPASEAPGDLELSGSAGGLLPEGFGPWTGDPVSFDIEARSTPAGTSGTFDVSHVHPGGELVAEFTGDITCLAVGGDVAVATGVITEGVGHLPDAGPSDLAGQRVSFTVHDDGRKDRMFWQWEFLGAPISDCQGTAPVFDPGWGNFRVSGEML